MEICETFMLIAERCAKEHGAPIGNRGVLCVGDKESGWCFELNTDTEPRDDIPPANAAVYWNGFPAGIIGPDGGVIAAGELANQESLNEWLVSSGRQSVES